MRGGLMKILTVVIPCYNSEAYMCKAIDHALIGGPDVEVLIVDDGSKDNTLKKQGARRRAQYGSCECDRTLF